MISSDDGVACSLYYGAGFIPNTMNDPTYNPQ